MYASEPVSLNSKTLCLSGITSISVKNALNIYMSDNQREWKGENISD